MSITKVELPDSVTNIDGSAFMNCYSLTNIELPNSVTSIGDSAFRNCNSLKNIEISNSVTSIGDSAFRDCKSLTNIEIPNSVTSIGDYAFEGTLWIVNERKKNPLVVINHILIDGFACAGDVTIPKGVTRISGFAFERCKNLKSVVIPKGVTSIGDYAFYECIGLTEMEIPNSVTSIGNYAFNGCDGLKKVKIPNSVTSIGLLAFSGKNLTIYGDSGSEAEKFAKDNGFAFRLLSDYDPAKADISKATISLDKTSYTYDGKAKTPSVTVKLDGKTLAPNTDYTVSYSDNTNVGTAKVTVTGKGNYTGSKTVNFTITKAEQDSSITCKKTLYKVAYGTNPFKIKVTSKSKLTFTSSSTKIASVDKNTGKVTIKNTGVATITVKAGKNSVKVTVKVSPKKQTVKSVKAVKGKKLTVGWAKDKMASGYQVQISTAKNFKADMKSKNVSKTSYTFTKLKTGKKYYVRVRSYKKSGKETLYGDWSKAKQSTKVKK